MEKLCLLSKDSCQDHIFAFPGDSPLNNKARKLCLESKTVFLRTEKLEGVKLKPSAVVTNGIVKLVARFLMKDERKWFCHYPMARAGSHRPPARPGQFSGSLQLMIERKCTLNAFARDRGNRATSSTLLMFSPSWTKVSMFPNKRTRGIFVFV